MTDNAQAVVDTAVALVTDWGLQVVGAFAILIIGRLLAGWARNLTKKSLERGGVDKTLVPFLSKMVSYLLLVSEDGRSVNREVLEFVAEPVQITGRVVRRDDLLILYADPSTYRLL